MYYNCLMRLPNRKSAKYKPVQFDPVLTKAKAAAVARQLERLKKSQRPPAAAEVARLAELGDFSENVEYQLAKGRLRGINNRILILENQLRQAVIITPPASTGAVRLGHTVTIEGGGKKRTYQILGSAETNPRQGIISHNSPLGAALIGRKAGETVRVRLAKKEVEYKILKIE